MASPGSPNVSPKRRVRTLARTVERTCLTALSYFPLAFVYGITTWAVWVDAGIGLLPTKSIWLGMWLRTSSFKLSFIHALTHLPPVSIRFTELSCRSNPIYNAESILYSRRLHRSRFTPFIVIQARQRPRSVQSLTNDGIARISELHSQLAWRS